MTTTPGSINVELLRKFYRQLGALKQKAGLSALRPVWLMLCALEGLMHQLSNKVIGADSSVFRTVEGALDFLDALCVPGLDPALATRTPVELLAVDDNSVCLAAVSIALRKAFRKPDVAAEGLSARAMAEKKRYDVIFLDVEMPGMNGFDLCAAIRKTDLNRTTPVVFVTSHGDFESRAKSALVGGQELIAKPFHSFEITVKALTLALRGRFEADAVASRAKAKETADSDCNLVFSCLPGSPLPSKG
jgi:CheY-like chemotaxis protein